MLNVQCVYASVCIVRVYIRTRPAAGPVQKATFTVSYGDLQLIIVAL